MDQISRIGMDTSKHIFQLHGVNAAEAPVLRKKLRRKEMVTFFENLAPTEISIEACGGSHHWARLLQSFGHRVRLIPPQLVKPYVKRGKNDAADAEALCEAMSRPTMRFVPVKTADQQAALMLVGVEDAGSRALPIGAAVCGLDRLDTEGSFDRGQSEARGDHARWRRGVAQRAGGRGDHRDPARSTQRQSLALAGCAAQAEVAEIGSGGAGQQNGAHCLEDDGYGRNLQGEFCACRCGKRRIGSARHGST